MFKFIFLFLFLPHSLLAEAVNYGDCENFTTDHTLENTVTSIIIDWTRYELIISRVEPEQSILNNGSRDLIEYSLKGTFTPSSSNTNSLFYTSAHLQNKNQLNVGRTSSHQLLLSYQAKVDVELNKIAQNKVWISFSQEFWQDNNNNSFLLRFSHAPYWICTPKTEDSHII